VPGFLLLLLGPAAALGSLSSLEATSGRSSRRTPWIIQKGWYCITAEAAISPSFRLRSSGLPRLQLHAAALDVLRHTQKAGASKHEASG